MKSIFITGTPAAGKTTLAKKLESDFGYIFVETDSWREELCNNPETKEWVNFFWNQDEEEYWNTHTCSDHWDNLVKQSESFWTLIETKIRERMSDGDICVFEGVNLLPHLMNRIPEVQGIVLVNRSEEYVLERLKLDARWGETLELQKIEAGFFAGCEAELYAEEALKYNYPSFEDGASAYDYIKENLI